MRRTKLALSIMLLWLAACGRHDESWFRAHPDQARQLLATCPFKPHPDCVAAEAALKGLMEEDRAKIKARKDASRAKWLAMIDQYDGLPLVEIEKAVATCSATPIADLDYENGCTAVREAINRAKNRGFRDEVDRYKALPAAERFKLLRPKGARCHIARRDASCEALRTAEDELTDALVAQYRRQPAVLRTVYDQCAAEWDAARAPKNAIANPFSDWTRCMAAKRATGLGGVDRLAY